VGVVGRVVVGAAGLVVVLPPSVVDVRAVVELVPTVVEVVEVVEDVEVVVVVPNPNGNSTLLPTSGGLKGTPPK